MSFKLAKALSLVLKMGKVVDQFHFIMGGIQIPSLTEKPIKILGKMHDQSLKDAVSLLQTRSDLTAA